MLHIFHGADSFSRHEQIAGLRAHLDGDGMLATNTTQLDARGLNLADLMLLCDATPFLGSCRFVHVQGLLARTEGERPAGGRRGGRTARAGGGDSASTGWLALADYVPRMPPTTVLVLEDGDIRTTNPLLAALVALPPELVAVHPFPRMSTRQVAGWIGERARRRGVLFDPVALNLLAESVSVEPAEDRQWHALWALSGEIEKLSLYARGARISEGDVRRLVPAALESRAYLLADKVAEQRGAEALALLEELLAAGRPAPVLLATIAGRVRQLLLFHDLTAAGASRAAITARLGIRTDWQHDRLREQARRFSPARLEAAYLRILATDRDIKRGLLDEVIALELLVAELAG